MKVTAIKRGFIYGVYRREGDKFELTQDKHLSNIWMSVDKEVKIVKKEIPSLEIPSLMPEFNSESKDIEKPEKQEQAKPKKKKAKKKSNKKAD